MNEIKLLEDKGYVSLQSIGDIYGEPVTTTKAHGQKLHHNYLLWVGFDAVAGFNVAKYYSEYPASLDDGEQDLAKRGYKQEPSNWAVKAPDENVLNTLNFAGAGRFSIVLGIPGWEFYNFPEPGHEPVVFHRSKTFFEPDSHNQPIKVPVEGTYNRSFYNGNVDTIEIDGNKFAIFRCDNIVADKFGNPIHDGVTLPLLFDINLRVPIGNTGKYALIIIDPVGGNQGPPSQP